MSCAVCIGYDSLHCPCCGTEIVETNCPICSGTGQANWKLYDITNNIVIPCSEAEYINAPDDEDAAALAMKNFCKDTCICEACDGSGIAYKDESGNIVNP